MFALRTEMNSLTDFALHKSNLNASRHFHRVALCHESVGAAVKRQVENETFRKIDQTRSL